MQVEMAAGVSTVRAGVVVVMQLLVNQRNQVLPHPGWAEGGNRTECSREPF